ncbi:hypothetical protein COT72_03655 [archaeon CG10_big_fil_rev_8_21_14_0_10_43_11]|nr:MAG: hypothetical protein COT72_03655 [archaeon CG10_big_fil_rev_8_21_14_0_10_43_11]
MHAFTAVHKEEVLDALFDAGVMKGNKEAMNAIQNEAHDLLTLKYQELVSTPQEFQRFKKGYLELLEDTTHGISEVKLMTERPNMLDTDWLVTLLKNPTERASIAEWFVVDPKAEEMWTGLLQQLTTLHYNPTLMNYNVEIKHLSDVYTKIYENPIK